MKSKSFLLWGVLYLFLSITVFSNCGGSSSSSSGEDDTSTTITLSGQVAVSASDASLALSGDFSAPRSIVKPSFVTRANEVLPNATITLYKVLADKTETQVNIGTVTTGTDGSYSIPDVPVPTSGTGATTDFFYEIRATSGDITVKAPTAAQADTTVNMGPESTLAAMMISDVQDVSGDVLPIPQTIENLRNLAVDELEGDLANLTLPSLADADTFLVASTAVGNNGGNAEAGLEGFESEKELLALGNATDAAVYLETVNKKGCDFNTNFSLPTTARDALANALLDGTTTTLTEVVDAYNANNEADPDTDAGTVATNLTTQIENISDAITDGTLLNSDDKRLLLVKRDFDSGGTLSASTPLEMDQALAIVEGLFPTTCEPGTFDTIGFAADITGENLDSTPAIIDTIIYNSSSGDCTDGHLVADIQVFAAGGATVNGVTLSYDGTTENLTREVGSGPVSKWRRNVSASDADFNPDFDCVPFEDTNFTIAVDLESAEDLSGTAVGYFRDVPEASISYVAIDGQTTVLFDSTVTNAIPYKRPFFKWNPEPGTPSEDDLTDPPEGSQFKFTFELSHVLNSEAMDRLAPTENEGPLSECGIGGSNQKLMDRNYFISNTDCDPAACLAILQASSTLQFENTTVNTNEITETDIECRTNISTLLVDDYDRYLGQAGGNFRKYCYDDDGDGNC